MLIAIQDAYIADLLKAEQVTKCYGNRSKSRAAARRRFTQALSVRGYDEASIDRCAHDAYAVFQLERDAD
jgi:hypothetical protein